MRNARCGIGIALVLGALVLPVPAAVAAGAPAGDSGIQISPGDAAPGSTVTVSTKACGPEVTYGKGESKAGGAFHLFEGDREGVLTGQFQIPDEARSGSDTVIVKCPPRIKLTGTYQVSGRRPSGAVDAGFGAEDKETRLALGAALLVAAAAGSVARIRRRPRGLGS
ncbi:sortase [Streptomyces sp. NPDC058220]|uniref:sortase n=1 Tax=unclassified Streptomyces TaxID=2593676 RepID=UPI0036556544